MNHLGGIDMYDLLYKLRTKDVELSKDCSVTILYNLVEGIKGGMCSNGSSESVYSNREELMCKFKDLDLELENSNR
jgi:hypothetical protein